MFKISKNFGFQVSSFLSLSQFEAEKYVTSAYVTATKRQGRSIHDDAGNPRVRNCKID